MYSLLRRLLFLLPTEHAHSLALNMLNLTTLLLPKADSTTRTACTVMGLHFPNRVGLAAGLDKNGEYIEPLSRLGFGFLEVGTVTPKAQLGNPKPRLFRLPSEHALINRMGFNNKGIDYLLNQVHALTERPVLGINVGKGYATPIPAAVEDYLFGLEKAYPLADYITINISSPNTLNLRQMQTPELLTSLLHQLKEKQAVLAQQYRRYVPLAVKISPDMSVPELEAVARILLEAQIDAVIATNTTIDRKQINHALGKEEGGLSGAPLFAATLDIVQLLYSHFGNKIPIIACGGIMSREQGVRLLNAGAQLLQVYTGLIYKGPQLIRQLASL